MTTILIVEDNANVQLLLDNVIGADFAILNAANGQQALEIFHAKQPDLIITDLAMPEMDGFDLMRAIRATGARLPIIVCSGLCSSENSVADQAYAAGADFFIEKPFNIANLMQLI